MKCKKILQVVIIAVLSLGLGSCGEIKDDPTLVDYQPVETEQTIYPLHNENGLKKESFKSLYKEFEESKKINQDVKGVLYFDTGLIYTPVLQDKHDVNKYLYLDWETGAHANHGSVTLNPNNTLQGSEMNTIIYGHYIYDWKVKIYGFEGNDWRLVFTHLRDLMNQEGYEENKYLTLITEDEARYYEVARVYDCPLVINSHGDEVTLNYMEFNRLSFTKDYWDNYMRQVDAHSYIKSDVKLEYGEPILTLQTCIQNRPNNREIVICKELMRMPVEDAKKGWEKAKRKAREELETENDKQQKPDKKQG